MKWRDIIASILSTECDTHDMQCLKRCAARPTFMTLVEGHYRSSGFMKPRLKRYLLDCVERAEREQISTRAVPSVEALVRHTCKVLSVHENAEDQVVRRWAGIAKELSAVDDDLVFLCRLATQSDDARKLTSSSLLWTLSECNRRKCFVLPFIDEHEC